MPDPTPNTQLVEHRPLRHGLAALIVRRCPQHPVDHVTDTGVCLACADELDAYGVWLP